MALPEIGRPLPRAADGFVDDEKWLGYVLSDRGHRGHWSRAFGFIDPDALWMMIARAVLDADVTEMRTVKAGGISCRVSVTITINDRSRAVRTVWHYGHADAAPRQSQPSRPPNIDSMAVAQKIKPYDQVELLEPVDAAPAGARGPVIHFLNSGEVAEIELSEPRLEGLDGIVYAPLSKLRRID